MVDYSTKASVSVPASEEDARVILAIHQAILAKAIEAGHAWPQNDEDLDDDLESDGGAALPVALDLDANGIPVEFSGWDLEDLLQEAGHLQVSLDEDGLWLRDSDDNFPLAYAACLVREHLVRTKSQEVVSWTYGLSADKPVLDGFGGGIVTVSAQDYEIQDLSVLMDKAVIEAKNRMTAAAILARHKEAGADEAAIRDDLDLRARLREAFALKADDVEGLPLSEIMETLLDLNVDPARLEPFDPEPEMA